MEISSGEDYTNSELHLKIREVKINFLTIFKNLNNILSFDTQILKKPGLFQHIKEAFN